MNNSSNLESLAQRKEKLRGFAIKYSKEAHEYTDTSDQNRLIADWERKESLAQGVVSDFARRATDPKGTRILDVGFGNGVQLAAFAKAGGTMSGVEINNVLLNVAREYAAAAGVTADMQVYDGNVLPFADETFDAAYSISVLEHASYPKRLLEEVSRVVRPGGVFYLAFPNRFSPRETHTQFWCISWLPRPLAEWILLRFKKNTIQEINLHFISYFSLRRMLRGTGFSVRSETGGTSTLRRFAKKFLAFFGLHYTILLPHIMVVLVKDRP